jgi:hypothetical protein
MKTSTRIDVWISPEGAITIDAVGYTGNTCEEATAFLEEALGTVGRKQRTRDYYRRQTNHNQKHQNPNDNQQTQQT